MEEGKAPGRNQYVILMQNLLKLQYLLVKEAREVVFDYLENQVREDISTNISAFNNKSIAYLMVHIANTYIAWAGNFAMKTNLPYYTEKDDTDVADLREIFLDVDAIMNTFSDEFVKEPMTPVKGYKWPDKYIETDAFSIFTHILTHEFHHKGQIMTMSRLLGYTPPDTDILRF